MTKTYHLDQDDIEQAVIAFVRSQDGEDTSQDWTVLFNITKGDRPGESDSISASVVPSDRGQR